MLTEWRVKTQMLLRRKPLPTDDVVWVHVRGTNKKYSVSNKGEIRRNPWKTRQSNGVLKGRDYPYVIKPYQREKGRRGLYVKLRIHNKIIVKNLAYLVANHFLYKPVNSSRLEWIDGDTHNNAVHNLRWK